MPTCRDCESIIMEGDPYCPYCGAHINWNQNTEENHIPEKKNPQPITKADEKSLTDVLNEACTDTTQKLQLKALIKGFF